MALTETKMGDIDSLDDYFIDFDIMHKNRKGAKRLCCDVNICDKFSKIIVSMKLILIFGSKLNII